MKSLFKKSLFGYSINQVNKYISSLRKDYEQELCKKKDRMFELNEENRTLRRTLGEYEEKLFKYEEQELYISKALIKAEEKAESVMKECYNNKIVLEQKIGREKEKWKIREKEVRKRLLDYQNEAYELMDNIQAELNYLASKELSDEIEDKSIHRKDKKEGILNASAM